VICVGSIGLSTTRSSRTQSARYPSAATNDWFWPTAVHQTCVDDAARPRAGSDAGFEPVEAPEQRRRGRGWRTTNVKMDPRSRVLSRTRRGRRDMRRVGSAGAALGEQRRVARASTRIATQRQRRSDADSGEKAVRDPAQRGSDHAKYQGGAKARCVTSLSRQTHPTLTARGLTARSWRSAPDTAPRQSTDRDQRYAA
jgi:hypothetical protein